MQKEPRGMIYSKLDMTPTLQPLDTLDWGSDSKMSTENWTVELSSLWLIPQKKKSRQILFWYTSFPSPGHYLKTMWLAAF